VGEVASSNLVVPTISLFGPLEDEIEGYVLVGITLAAG
jgi:hypothetical protein